MSKGLEALKKLGEMTLESEYGDDPKIKGLVLYEIIEKELKALEIIKPYLEEIIGMNVYDKDFYECFLQIGNKRVFITKEEYELLKGIL